jgi:N-acetylneuraminic acid mutarotase
MPPRALVTILATLLLCLACSDDEGNSPLVAPMNTAPTIPAAVSNLGWVGFAPLPTPRSEVASAALDGKIYVIGGFDAQGNSTNVLEVYAAGARANTWERKAPLPEGRDHPMAAAFGGKVYLFGGGRGDATRTVFVYDPASDTWSRGLDMPYRRTAGGAAVIGDRIIVVGGVGDMPGETMVYDPAANTWSIGPPLPEPREHLGVTSAGGVVYVVGGRWNDQLKATNEALSSLTGSWRRLAPMPTARGGTAAGSLDGRVYVAGGEAFNPSRTFSEVEVYDPATNTWTSAPPLPTPRHGLAVQGAGTDVYVIGGGPTAGLSVSPQNEALSPK